MKKLFLLMIAAALAANLYSRENSNAKAVYRAIYSYFYKTDSLKSGYAKDVFHLDICMNGKSFFYSRAAQYRDSLLEAETAKGMKMLDVLNNYRSVSRGLEWQIEKSFMERKYNYTSKVVKYYSYREPLQMPQWNFLEDTLTILGYPCRKAEAEIEGRTWTVWYAPDIPINDGPWMFWGLPGLVLYGIDKSSLFVFKCTAVGQLPEPVEVVLPPDNKEVLSSSKHKVLDMEEVMAKDPLLLLENDNVSVKAAMPVKSQKRPYIPIVKRK